MKVCIVVSNITACAGTERVVIGVANYLVHLKYEVVIISLFSKYGSAYFQLDSNITIIHVGAYKYTEKGWLQKTWGRFSSLYNSYRVIRRVRADIYIGTSVNTNVLSILFSPSKRIIGCEHFAATVPMNSCLRLFRNRIYRRLVRLIVLTQRDCDYYKKNKVKAKVIQNTIPFPIPLSYPYKSKVVLAVGRHSREKAFDRLLSIWKKIEHARLDWHLILVGEGDLLEYNKEVATKLEIKNVQFLPFQKNIQDYYMNASLYFMTSLYEALPMVLIEAKACGCVCISYDCKTGPAEIIKDGNDGFLISEGDEDSFVNKALLLMEDQNKRTIMGKRAMVNAQDYSNISIMPKWKNLLDTVMQI